MYKNTIYEINVTDKNGDRHRYISDEAPTLEDDLLLIEHFDGDTTYFVPNIISWTIKDISELESMENEKETANAL